MNYEFLNQESLTKEKANINYDNKKDFGFNNHCEECGCMLNNCIMPICECPHENVCHKYIYYDVPHIMPCHTRIINHHIYRHTYRPEYTCCEENIVENICCNR